MIASVVQALCVLLLLLSSKGLLTLDEVRMIKEAARMSEAEFDDLLLRIEELEEKSKEE